MPPIFMTFGIRGHLTDLISCVKFLVDRFRGYGVLIPLKLPFPIDLLHHPYNSVALPCDTWIKHTNISEKLTPMTTTTAAAVFGFCLTAISGDYS